MKVFINWFSGKGSGKGLCKGSAKVWAKVWSRVLAKVSEGFWKFLAKVFNRCVMNFSHNDIYSGFINFSTFCCVFVHIS